MTGRILGLAMAGLVAGCGSQQTATTNTAAAAAEPSTKADRPRRGYLRADADDDGVVTRAEIAREAEARFRGVDTDGDGVVSSAKLSGRRRRALGREGEVKGMRPPEPVTLAAFRDRALDRFDRRDADGNGRLEGDELKRRPRLKRPEGL